jgi:hypothetical protein
MHSIKSYENHKLMCGQYFFKRLFSKNFLNLQLIEILKSITDIKNTHMKFIRIKNYDSS